MAWTDISGATGLSYNTGALDRDDDGSEYRLIITDTGTDFTGNSNDANAWLREHTLQYAIEITTSTTTTNTDYGLVDGVFRFITGRPGYDGAGPNYPVDEDGTSNTNVWYEGWMLDEGLGNAQRSVDITKTGAYGTFSSFQFRLRNNEKFWDFLETNDIYLMNRRVQLYCVYGDTFYKEWSGVISNVPYDETDYTVNCIADFNKIHKYIPPEIINDTNYPDADADSKGNPVPVVFGDVVYAELFNLKNELTDLPLYINSEGERIKNVAAAAYVFDETTSKPTLAIIFEDIDDTLITKDDLIGSYLFATGGTNSNTDRGVRIADASIFGMRASDLYSELGISRPSSVDETDILNGFILVLEQELDTSPDTFNEGVGDDGPYLYDQNASSTVAETWWFKIVKVEVILALSNDDVSFADNTPNLYTYNEQKGVYEDITFTIDQSDSTSDNQYGHPYISTVASVVNSEGESTYLVRLRPDPASPTNTAPVLTQTASTAAEVFPNFSKSVDLDRSTSFEYKSENNGGLWQSGIQLTIVLDPEQLQDDLVAVYMPVDLGVLCDVDVEMSFNYTIEDSYGRIFDTLDNTQDITLDMEDAPTFANYSLYKDTLGGTNDIDYTFMATGSNSFTLNDMQAEIYGAIKEEGTTFFLRAENGDHIQKFTTKSSSFTTREIFGAKGTQPKLMYTYTITTNETADDDYIATYVKRPNVGAIVNNILDLTNQVYLTKLDDISAEDRILTVNAAAGTNSIYIGDTSGFSAGDELRIVKTEGSLFEPSSESLIIQSVDSSIKITTTTNLVNTYNVFDVSYITGAANFNYIPNKYYDNGGNANDEVSLFNVYDDTLATPSMYSDVFKVGEDILEEINSRGTAKRLYMNISWESTSEHTIYIKEYGVIARKALSLVNDKLYSRISGESYDGTDANTVYGAFRLMLEKYDEIPAANIEYDNLASVRSNWYVARQLTDRRRTFEYIRELCSHSFVCAYPTRDAKLKLKAWREDDTIVDTHDNTVIVRDSIRPIKKSSVKDNYNDFYIEYHWNPALEKYEKSLYITKTDGTFPGVDSTETGSGRPSWYAYVGGTKTNPDNVNSGYADGKYLWDLCNDAYERTETINEIPDNFSKLPWYYDSILYDDSDYNSHSTQTGAYKFLVNAAEWCTRSRDHVFYAIPINDTNLTLELLDRVYFNDSIYSNSTDWDGWIDSIQIDTRNHQMILGVTLNPDGIPEGDIEETTTADDTVDESGSRTDTITEGRTI